MNWLDIAIIVLMAVSIFFGIRRGLVKEIFTLLALIVGIFIAAKYYPEGAKIIGGLIQNSNVATLVSFVILFSIVAVSLFVVSIVVGKLIQITKLGWIDRLGGLAFGFLRGAIIIGVSLVFLTKYPILKTENWINDAMLPPFFFYFIEYAWRLISPDLVKSITA